MEKSKMTNKSYLDGNNKGGDLKNQNFQRNKTTLTNDSELNKISLSASVPLISPEIKKENNSDKIILNGKIDPKNNNENISSAESNKNFDAIDSEATVMSKALDNHEVINSNRENFEIDPLNDVNYHNEENEIIYKATLVEHNKDAESKEEALDKTNLRDGKTDKVTSNEINAIMENINLYIKFEEDNIKKSYSIINDDYLVIEDYIIDQELIKIKFQKFFDSFDHKKDLVDLKKQIDKVNIKSNTNNNIGPVSTLDYLVETSFNSDSSRKRSIMENLMSLEDLVFRWRKIGGDGNCYYRAVIFSYLESIIFEKNISLFQYVILDINRCFQNEPYLIKKMSRQSIKSELVLKILILLYISLTLHSIKGEEKEIPNDIMKTYDLFLRCFNQCKHFDYGLIYYFRFKLFEYIRSNENKLYTKDFSVKIGNLLPVEYETEEGNFLWDNFYEDYLMKFYKDAEKIVIYITPFVLKVDIKVLIYDFGKNFVEKMKEFPCFLKQNSKITPITLLYKRTHYDLIYEQKYFEKHTRYLTLFVNLDEDLKVITSEMIKEITKFKNKEKIKDLEENEKQENNKLREPVNNNQFPMVKKNDKPENYNLSQFIDINMVNLSKTNIFHPKSNEEKKSENELHSQNINEININQDTSILTTYNEPKRNTFQLLDTNFNEDNEPVNNNEAIKEFNINIIQPAIKCNLCKEDYIPYQNMLKLCNTCILNEIKTNMLSKYIIFLSNSKENFQKNPEDSIKTFKIVFYDTKVKIMDENLDLNVAFKLIETDFREFLIKEIKSSICTICENSINVKNSALSLFMMPCGCTLCSQKCLKSYLDLIFNTDKKYKKEFICICSTVYNTNDMKQLFFFCHSNNIKTTKEKIINHYRERIVSQCMLCLQEKNKDGNFNINIDKGNYSSRNNKGKTNISNIITAELKDAEIEKILHLKNFNHLMCFPCFEDQFLEGKVLNTSKSQKFEINKTVFCMICNGVHLLTTCKLLNTISKVSLNSDCKIV